MSSSTRASPTFSTASTVATDDFENNKSSSPDSDDSTMEMEKVATLGQQMIVAQQALTELQAEQIASLQAKLKVTALSQKIVAAQRTLTKLQAKEIASLRAELKKKKQKASLSRVWDNDQELIDEVLNMSVVKGQALKELKHYLKGVRAQAKAARKEGRTNKWEAHRG